MLNGVQLASKCLANLSAISDPLTRPSTTRMLDEEVPFGVQIDTYFSSPSPLQISKTTFMATSNEKLK
jgi:hypothetical protein